MSRLDRILQAVYDVRFLLVVVIITMMLAILIPIRQNSDQNKQLLAVATSNKEVGQSIEDCVDPKGECAKESQKRTAAVIQQLQEITILANACSVSLTQNGSQERTLEELEELIRKCVQDELRERRNR